MLISWTVSYMSRKWVRHTPDPVPLSPCCVLIPDMRQKEKCLAPPPHCCRMNALDTSWWHWTSLDRQVNRGSMEIPRCVHCKRRCPLCFLLPRHPWACSSHLWLGRTSLGPSLIISWKRDAVTIPSPLSHPIGNQRCFCKHVQSHRPSL